MLIIKKNKTTTGIRNLAARWSNGHLVSLQVQITRNGIKRSRQFLITKFKNIEFATARAIEYIRFLKLHANTKQFKTARRSPGRPLKSEFFGRRIVRN
jgi:hypothetical protein